jgi:flagellar basal-body rod protein FlgC
MFGTFDISASGMSLSSVWMDLIAHNLANQNNVAFPGQEPYRALSPVAAEAEGGGVQVAGIVADGGPANVVSDPGNPMADADGNVSYAVVDTAGQMVDMIVAQRSYTANIRAVESAKEMYQAALRIGR